MNVKKLLSKFFITLTKLIPSGLPLIILQGPLKGYKLIMGAAAGGGKGISIIFNRSEPKRLNVTKNLISKNFICFDVGANIGILSLLFSKYSKLVYAFEPFPRNLKLLNRMLTLNKIENVKIVPSAVAEKNGLSWFQEASSVAEGKLDDIGTQSVKTISLDNFIEKRKIKPDLLKIDVEGAELKVLKGVENYLFEHKPLIVIETHGELIKDQCFNFLNKLGYTNFIPIDANSIEKASDFVIKP